MKLFIAIALLSIYTLFLPGYFVEGIKQIHPLNESTSLILEYLAILGGVVMFVGITPVSWIKSSKFIRGK
ncbi:hypothetical protein TUMSATVNIG1_59690 (plasmid) [Vibrio nigripulchritudo]|uniref:hypothetical protein n=1 Tax=Vibrio nigripulchritudo TaxID=28173 RepID=UPI00190BDB87|nr:hypothetical protein [Vibrio nigripulchritudo]BCL73983.1 hypothetical protein VNTUMSATTG_59200 [Vibrio nigripulchritudo]BDU35360.1 hypothetical protein TUMSATVNIG1_59690 [Vibrio nigripulchritudo]